MKKTSRLEGRDGSMIHPDIQSRMLHSCKFCGSEKRGFKYVFVNIFVPHKKIVACDDCGYKTSRCNTEYEAMKEWNNKQE